MGGRILAFSIDFAYGPQHSAALPRCMWQDGQHDMQPCNLKIAFIHWDLLTLAFDYLTLSVWLHVS